MTDEINETELTENLESVEHEIESHVDGENRVFVVPEDGTESNDEPETKHRVLNSDNTKIPGALIEFIHGNLVRAFIEEAQNLPTLWEKMSDEAREEYKDRVTERAEHHIIDIASAINGQNFERCTALVDTVTNKDEVKIVLKTHDMDGGEKFFRRAGGGTVICVFADEKEYMNAKGMPKLDKKQGDLLESSGETGEAATDENGNDPLYQQSVDLVIVEGRVSISMIQREIKVGYNRAARIVDAMELNGIVSSADESGQRTVLTVPYSIDQETPMLYRVGTYDLIVDDELETSVSANDLDDAAGKLGYSEFGVQEQGTETEYALILDDERVLAGGVIIKIQYSENQPEHDNG